MLDFNRGCLRRLGSTALPVARTQTSEPAVLQAQVVTPHWSARMGPSDQRFIEQLIPHHQMGAMMATMEFNNSQRPEMRKLAEEMVRVQSEEINTMQRWYRNWYS
jgi:uncharacterized protein (DUF305 family)